MKKRDEIMQGINACKYTWTGEKFVDCDGKCPYSKEALDCKASLHCDVRLLIQQLEQEKFDVLDEISTAYYGKMMYGLNDDGTVYSRYSCEDMTFDEAVQELVSLLYKENE
jgi:hypothetical protein